MAYKNNYGEKKAASKETVTELKRRLKDGDYSGLYVFSGDEEYMKRYYFSELCKAAGDNINILTLRGEIDFEELRDALTSVPMMEFSFFESTPKTAAPKRIVKLDSPDFSKLSKTELAATYDIFSDIGDMSVVVIYFSDIDGTKGKTNAAIIKKISENALNCDFQRAAPGDATLLRWIKKHFDKAKINISAENVRYLSDCVGTDMCLLSNEIEKLNAYSVCENRNEILRSDIDKVCIKTEEAITFDVTNAIIAQNFQKAAESLLILKQNKTDPILIFGAVAKTANDMSTVASLQKKGCLPFEISKKSGLKDFVVKKYVNYLRNAPKNFSKRFSSLCLECDRKLKSGADGYRTLENLIFQLTIF